MSKRAGTFVTLRDVVEQVGPDVTRFVMLTRKNDAPLDFDFDKVLEQSKDNPVFYVQYAHARVCVGAAQGRRGGPRVDDAPGPRDRGRPSRGTGVLRQAGGMAPPGRELAARTGEPHRVAFYLYDLASAFHGLWNLGHDAPAPAFRAGGRRRHIPRKIALARAVGVVISAGLGILGVTPVDEMR